MLTNIYLPRWFRYLVVLALVANTTSALVGVGRRLWELFPGHALTSHMQVLERYEAMRSKSELARSDDAIARLSNGSEESSSFLEETVLAIMAHNGTRGLTPAEYVSMTDASLERCEQQMRPQLVVGQ